MPLFEFDCQQCDSRFELLIRDGESPACPQCQSQSLEKLFSTPAAHTGRSLAQPCDLPISNGPCGRGGCGLPECGS